MRTYERRQSRCGQWIGEIRRDYGGYWRWYVTLTQKTKRGTVVEETKAHTLEDARHTVRVWVTQ